MGVLKHTLDSCVNYALMIRGYDMDMTALSIRVKEAIDQSGVSVNEIAAACGISVQAVYQWKKGDSKTIKGDNIVELAYITGYEAMWILKGKGPKKRVFAKTNQQEHVLKSMQIGGEQTEKLITKIVDSVYEQDGAEDAYKASGMQK